MSKHNPIEFKGREAEFEDRAARVDPLTELLQTGAEKLIHPVVEAELYAQPEQYADRRTEAGHAGVVRNGYLPEREIQTGIGPVTVKIPKVQAKTGEPVTFQSALLPPYVRKTQSPDAPAALLDAQDNECAELPSQVCSTEG